MGQTVELMDRITVNPDQCGGRPCTTFGVEAAALRDLGLRDAEDAEIFRMAREAGAVLLSNG